MSLFLTNIAASSSQQSKRYGIFSLGGRIARAHYICYTFGSVIASVIILYLLGFAAILMGEFGRPLYTVSSILLFYVFLPVFFTIMTIKRAHDFGMAGWLALLLFVPIINLCFWFIPGSRDENRYGPVTPEPTLSLKIAAVAIPLIFVGGYLATVGSMITSSNDVRPAAGSDTSLQPYTP